MSEAQAGGEGAVASGAQSEPPKVATGVGALVAEWTDFSITLIKSGLIGIYLTSLLFVIGWAYADRYFELFGISLSGIDRDLEGAFYIYALWALRNGWLFLLVSGVALVGTALLLHVYRFASDAWRPSAIFMIATIAHRGQASAATRSARFQRLCPRKSQSSGHSRIRRSKYDA